MGDINYLVKELDKEIQKERFAGVSKTKNMSQIKIQDLLPLLRHGFVAMDKDGNWYWYPEKPIARRGIMCFFGQPYESSTAFSCKLNNIFDIAPFEGDWKDSLIECGK